MAITFKGHTVKEMMKTDDPNVTGELVERFIKQPQFDVTDPMIREEARLAKARKKMDRTSKAIQSETGEAGRTLVSLRLDAEVVAFFKALGPGWTGRVNDVLVRVVRQGARGFFESAIAHKARHLRIIGEGPKLIYVLLPPNYLIFGGYFRRDMCFMHIDFKSDLRSLERRMWDPFLSGIPGPQRNSSSTYSGEYGTHFWGRIRGALPGDTGAIRVQL